MLLAIDIGNTNTVLGVFSGTELIGHWRLGSDPNRTTDEYAVLIRGLWEFAKIPPEAVDGVIIASVVPALNRVFSDVARAFLGKEPLLIGPGIKTGMTIKYDDPREVGADRIVNAVAAFDKYKAASIVVDFGTATTFDCVGKKGEYLGGVIAPGIGVSMEALFNKASKLPKVAFAKPPHIIAKNTVHAMQAGSYFGYAAMVEGLLKRLFDEMGQRPVVIATGGAARQVAEEIGEIDHVDEFLTLEGLRIIYQRNL